MFGRNGTCYVVMPKHVAGPFPRVTVSTAAPVETATATVIAPFWDGIDLAVGVARGALQDRCIAEMDDLEETQAGLAAARGQLLRLGPTGEETRRAIAVTDRTYLTFTGSLVDGGTDISQGTSGAFLFVDGRPLGMAITSDDPSRARFMRTGEILVHLRRFLDEQGGAYSPDAEAKVAPEAVADALPLRFVRSAMPPVNPQFAPENMLSDGQFVFSPQRRMNFVVGFDRITPVSRIEIRSSPSATQSAPKSIILNWSLDADSGRFREWYRAQMGPDGVFDTGRLTPRNLHNLEVIILDSWAAGDIVIDRISAY